MQIEWTNGIFDLVEKLNFCKRYPEYRHVCSKPDALHEYWHANTIKRHEVEVTLKLKV